VIERHERVQRVVLRSLPRHDHGELAGRGVLVVPSTYVQARLDFFAEEVELTAEHVGFALHAVVDGD
jgi:hypothetical protein